MAEMLSKDGKGYLPFPKEVVKRAMMLYDIPYPGNAAAIKHKDWGMDRINFQGWPYRSATELVVNDMKKTVITGDSAFLEKLDAKFVANDLVNYTSSRRRSTPIRSGRTTIACRRPAIPSSARKPSDL
jgi:NitT/TauT family transport system substrate-binding protein